MSIIEKQPRGKNLSNAKRMVIITKLIEALSESYYTTSELAKMTGLTRPTINKYRVIADEVIGKNSIDRNVIRNLQVKRTYTIIEMLMKDLNNTKNDKARQGYYNQIAKFSQHLALITGLNIETQVNVDQHQLVIIRADNNKRPLIESEPREKQEDIITISDSIPMETKQGHDIKTNEKG